LADRAAHVQRRGRQHDPLERPLPPLPPVRLPRAEPRRRRRRLAHRLRDARAVLRPERPHDGRGGGRPRAPPPPARPPRAAPPPAAPPGPGGSAGLAGHGGPRDSPTPPPDSAGRRACITCGPCDLGCPTGAKASTDITYWPKALAFGARLVTRARV